MKQYLTEYRGFASNVRALDSRYPAFSLKIKTETRNNYLKSSSELLRFCVIYARCLKEFSKDRLSHSLVDL